MINADIVTGISLMLLFRFLHLGSGFMTILLSLMMNGGLMMIVRQAGKNIHFSIMVIVMNIMMVGVVEDNLRN